MWATAPAAATAATAAARSLYPRRSLAYYSSRAAPSPSSLCLSPRHGVLPLRVASLVARPDRFWGSVHLMGWTRSFCISLYRVTFSASQCSHHYPNVFLQGIDGDDSFICFPLHLAKDLSPFFLCSKLRCNTLSWLPSKSMVSFLFKWPSTLTLVHIADLSSHTVQR
ncbi:hypothetical protein GUJ93_ZPchr0012g20886 [Zizania palustris]|uniref:Uncharacterized protein n=1 Tax=Zizania palustris TaxID=103762 RepID=A0A8J6BP62_ZIZPA|nr:hypothetical protein GUJ93_ZPchr0012g20886 [Zizania palustris]